MISQTSLSSRIKRKMNSYRENKLDDEYKERIEKNGEILRKFQIIFP